MPRTTLVVLLVTGAAALPCPAQWDPFNGQWGKQSPEHLRVMTYNVEDGLCSTNDKQESTGGGFNNWHALARVVASFKPDVLILQECGDNDGNGTGSGVDSVTILTNVFELFMHGGVDPYVSGNPTVTAYVQKYDATYDLPYIFVSSESDGFNRNALLSRYPFQDLNGDGKSTYSDLPFIIADQYSPGGDGGIRGIQLAEIDLPLATYPGDVVVSNAHLKAGSSSSDKDQRLDASQNLAYILDYWYNGAGTGVPDPNNKISDTPSATSILNSLTPVLFGGDWNEDEATNGRKGPAEWIIKAQLDEGAGPDGTDRDGSDCFYDTAAHPITGDSDTRGSSKLDYLGLQDSIASMALDFLYSSQGMTSGQYPAETLGFPDPGQITSWASDHDPVIVDYSMTTVTEPALVTLNEVYYDAPGGDDGQVFVEIHGPAGTDVSGYRIQGVEQDGSNNSESFTFPGGSLIPADGLLVVADDAGGTTSVASWDFIDSDMDLENGPDGVHLYDNIGTLIDAMAYGPVSSPVGEGNPARDVFAPLSLERCPAGADTGDNDFDFTPNVPTPGVASASCNAIEWVNRGPGSSISCAAGESVGLDVWMSGSGGDTMFLLISCTPPPPSPGLPVAFDLCTAVAIPLAVAGTPPFVNFRDSLDSAGRNLGQAAIDFSLVPPALCITSSITIYVGAFALGSKDVTNCVMITLDP